MFLLFSVCCYNLQYNFPLPSFGGAGSATQIIFSNSYGTGTYIRSNRYRILQLYPLSDRISTVYKRSDYLVVPY